MMAKLGAGPARRAFSILFVLAALIVSDSAEAWNAAGHRLSAAIAWRRMDDASRLAVGRLLAQHPEYAAWLARSRSAATDETSRAYLAFIEASTWAFLKILLTLSKRIMGKEISRKALQGQGRRMPKPGLRRFDIYLLRLHFS